MYRIPADRIKMLREPPWTSDSRFDPASYELGAKPMVQPTSVQSLVWKFKAKRGGPSYKDQWREFILKSARQATPMLCRSQALDRRPLTPVRQTNFCAASHANTGRSEHNNMLYVAQKQSPFFSKLPAEIRLAIWVQVLGYKTMHLVNGYIGKKDYVYRMNATICQQGCCFEDADSSHQTVEVCSEASPRVTYVLPLLMSCRRIYSEALSLLYSTNSFVLSPEMTMYHLKFYWPTGRFNMITKLRACFQFTTFPMDHIYEAEDWYIGWRSIASLRHLDQLIISIKNLTFYGIPPIHERELLDECKHVQQPSRFVLVLNWPSNPANQDVYRNLHCKIVRAHSLLSTEENDAVV